MKNIFVLVSGRYPKRNEKAININWVTACLSLRLRFLFIFALLSFIERLCTNTAIKMLAPITPMVGK